MRLFILVSAVCLTISSISVSSYAKVNLKEKLDQKQKSDSADILKKIPSEDSTVLPNGVVVDGTLYTIRMVMPSSTVKMPSIIPKYNCTEDVKKNPPVKSNKTSKNNKTKSK